MSAFESAIEQGVSANLCESVAAVAEHNNGADVSITWARTRPLPSPQTAVKFTRSDSDLLKEVARIFRERSPRNDVTLLGYPTTLQRAGKQSGGTVSFATFVDERSTSVSIDLGKEDYERAIDAHKRKLPMHVAGDLVREGQRWHLRNAHDVAVTVEGE